MFYCIFRDLRRFYFWDIQKLKYAAAYFEYTQARPCHVHHMYECVTYKRYYLSNTLSNLNQTIFQE